MRDISRIVRVSESLVQQWMKKHDSGVVIILEHATHLKRAR